MPDSAIFDGGLVNGAAQGDLASVLMANNFDPGVLRPYWDAKGRPVYTINAGTNRAKTFLTHNATATLRKDEWQTLDEAIIGVARSRMKGWADLMSMGLRYNVANGMGTTVLQTETVSDISPAKISMDAVHRGESDRPEYELTNLPLPIISKDFHFTARQIATSRKMGASIDTTTAELAGIHVAEAAEKLLMGTWGSYAFGGGNIYGYTNYPKRMTKTLTAPGSWTTPADFVTEVLEMIEQARAKNHFGPFVLYVSPSWDPYLDADYSASKGSNTLRQRVEQIRQIDKVETLDFLPTQTVVLVQKTSNVVRGVVGMNITTIQWQSQGGMETNFKVMAILVPQLRCDQNDQTGIVHGSY
jgi:uncharacterized linocin/CFP29 family protein